MDPPKKETCALLKYLLLRTKKGTGFGTRVIKMTKLSFLWELFP